jgi:flagellar FliJ protein
MKGFRFSLERVLELRKTQLEMEEVRFREATAAIAELDRMRAEVRAAAEKAELEVRRRESVMGADLAALGAFRQRAQQRAREIEGMRAQRQRRLAEREKALLEARRRCRLLERLKERRMEEWRAATDREMEAAAAELYLAVHSRQA